MNNFFQEFNNARNNQPNSKMLMEFNQKREYIEKGSHVSFVEGPDDKRFYRFVDGYEELHKVHKSDYIYSNNSNYEAHGKSGVLLMYNYIYNKFFDYLDKCIFIVDHDYNGLKGYGVLNIDGITITKKYSFENYFLEEENIEKIFKYLKIDEEYKTFKTYLDRFIFDISEFIRLKSTITNHKYLRLTSIYNNNEIFKFNFKNPKYYNYEYMEKESTNMLNIIKNNPQAYSYYKDKATKFTNNSDWVRGHDIYNFLSEYLKQKYNKDINSDAYYSDIVKLLNVDIIVKDGTGNILN